MLTNQLVRYAISLPPHIAVAKGGKYVWRVLKGYLSHYRSKHVSAFYDPCLTTDYACFDNLDFLSIEPNAELTDRILQHQCNLLGSGWLVVAPPEKNILQVSQGNRARSEEIRSLVDSGYTFIDWQLDFKSGYRWREDRLSGMQRYGHKPGVDVKVPWELARLQHLPQLALYGETGKLEKDSREFRNQVLDFSSANPPGFGVNWMCTMDVAIRAANLLVGLDLFRSRGAEFDKEFLDEFGALIEAHGKHIVGNLEWHDKHRANHYLADIAGLIFVATYMPSTPETDTWLAFAVRQLIEEVRLQFGPDGANFEASTSYHRLSTEMVVYATAMVLGLSEDKQAALLNYDDTLWTMHPSLPPCPVEMHQVPGGDRKSPFPPWYFERLEQMAEFTIHVTKPNGRIVQIGDNDNGRFFKMYPVMRDVDGTLVEEHLDHRGTVAAINGYFDRADFADFAGHEAAIESSIIRTLSRNTTVKSYGGGGAVGNWKIEQPPHDKALSVIDDITIILPDTDILKNLTVLSYPDFGLYVWRSDRFFLSMRCGHIGQNGNGGHAHNDQLAIELNIDGEDWIADPGTYLYTPSPKDRNVYRSVLAHSAPRKGGDEPASLNFGLFRLEDRAKAKTTCFGEKSFKGCHVGFGYPVEREIEVHEGSIRIIDRAGEENQEPAVPVMISDPVALRHHWNLILPFSPGYGVLERQET